jgi:hypothetical protein
MDFLVESIDVREKKPLGAGGLGSNTVGGQVFTVTRTSRTSDDEWAGLDAVPLWAASFRARESANLGALFARKSFESGCLLTFAIFVYLYIRLAISISSVPTTYLYMEQPPREPNSASVCLQIPASIVSDGNDLLCIRAYRAYLYSRTLVIDLIRVSQ